MWFAYATSKINKPRQRGRGKRKRADPLQFRKHKHNGEKLGIYLSFLCVCKPLKRINAACVSFTINSLVLFQFYWFEALCVSLLPLPFFLSGARRARASVPYARIFSTFPSIFWEANATSRKFTRYRLPANKCCEFISTFLTVRGTFPSAVLSFSCSAHRHIS